MAGDRNYAEIENSSPRAVSGAQTLVVASDLDVGTRHRSEGAFNDGSGKRPRRKKRTKYITEKQAMNLIEALHFAEKIGLPLNVSIDINWLMFSGFVDDKTRWAKCQERISKWFQRQRFPLTLIWVREMGMNGARHTHVLLHVPPWLMEGQFEAEFTQALEREGGPTHEKAIMIQPAPTPEGKLRYMLKGMRRRDADQLGIRRRASFQGELEGKRLGWTEPRSMARSTLVKVSL